VQWGDARVAKGAWL